MKHSSIFFSLAVLAFSTFACSRNLNPQATPANAETASTPVYVEKTLAAFNPIQGTDYLMAGIVPAAVTRDSSFNPFEWINNSRYYSGYSSYATYNYVFFNVETAAYQRLLPNNEYIIYQTAGYPQQVYDPNAPDKPAPVIEFWVYGVVKGDFNNDGFMDYQDKITVGISDVGGNGYTELIENVDSILSQYYKDPSTLFVIYRVNEKNFIAKLNPSTRELVSTTEMDLGEDVK
ncbi:MAG: hypothetical protein JNK32_08665 [Anaerolineales bacterium]|nr:hypothetical protein [Anaerolineales bacterium]